MKSENFTTMQGLEKHLRRHNLYGVEAVWIEVATVKLHCIFTVLA